MTEPDTLEALALQARHGDAAAFDRLGRVALPVLRRWALTQTGSADDADDIAQEALLRIHRGLPSFGFGSRFTTWAYTVTRRVSADWRRTRKRRLTLMRGQEVGFERTVVQPELTRDTERLTALVHEYFEKLPARQREVFDLADLQNVPIQTIGEMAGLSPVTVRVHLHRARAAIRTRILERHAEFTETNP